MILNINKTSSSPLYIQVYNEIKDKILLGELNMNEKLPSKRKLAGENNISENTVVNAYNQLTTEGYIMSVERKGYFVANIQYHYNLTSKEDTSLQIDAIDDTAGEEAEIEYDLTQSTPDKELFPFSVFSKLFRNLFQKPHEDLIKESPGKGIYPLRSSIQHYLSQSRGVPCTLEQIIIGPSSEYLLSILIQLLSHDIEFGFEDPGYQGFNPLMKRLHIPVHPISVDENGLKMSDLNNSPVDLICVTSNHQFPTGEVMPLGRRQELLEWTKYSKHRYILENDYDSEFKYSGIPISSLKYLDENHKVIHLGSFTRVISPGIRMSYMVLPERLLKIYKEKFEFHSSSISTMIQWVMNDFIEEGHFETHLNRSRTFYKKKRDKVIKEIHRNDTHAKIYGNKAGLHLLIKPSFAFNGEKFKERAYADKIKINLLSDYSLLNEESYNNIFFFSFSSIAKEDIRSIIERVYRLLYLTKV